jgi:hypothetical protein
MEKTMISRKNSYDEWSLYYQTNNMKWDNLTKLQQFVLIRAYKRKRNIAESIYIDNKIIINYIKKDLRLKFDYDPEINARMRLKFAI